MSKKRDLVDMDYLKKLNKKERAWLYKFVARYYYDFGSKEKSDEERKNSIRRDIWTQGKRVRADANVMADKMVGRPVPKPKDKEKKNGSK